MKKPRCQLPSRQMATGLCNFKHRDKSRADIVPLCERVQSSLFFNSFTFYCAHLPSRSLFNEIDATFQVIGIRKLVKQREAFDTVSTAQHFEIIE